MMINEHISKDSFPQESCPKGKESCKYGFQTCVYARHRFGIEPCSLLYPYISNKMHEIELE